MNHLDESEIWQEYGRARPAPGSAYKEWVKAQAEKRGVSAARVRGVIGQQIAAMSMAVSDARHTEAQRIAQAMGLTLSRAVVELGRQLKATKVVRITDKEGRSETFHDPDNTARNMAIRTAFAMFGANAPQQVQVEHEVGENLAALGEADIQVRLLEVGARLKQLAAGSVTISESNGSATPGGCGDTAAGSRNTRAGVAGEKSRAGLLLLADRVDPDDGRAGDEGSHPLCQGTEDQAAGGGS